MSTMPMSPEPPQLRSVGTTDTVMTSSPISPSEERGEIITAEEGGPSFETTPPTVKVAIEHSVTATSSRDLGSANASSSKSVVASLLFGVSKPFLCLLVVFLALIGVSGFLLSGFLKIPGLNNQIRDLEAQVESLTAQVDRLESENDRYELLNNELNRTASELKVLSMDFNSTAADLELVASGLNISNTDLTNQVNQLVSENARYAALNGQLTTIVSFVNQTAADLLDNNSNTSLSSVAEFLSSQIETNQGLVLQSLQNLYLQRISNWDCNFGSVFGLESFGQNFSQPIPEEILYTDVLNYVDEQVLSELCLNSTDFAIFLRQEYPDGGISTFRLIRAVSLYTAAALDYYFSSSSSSAAARTGGEGTAAALTTNDWVEASFQCDGFSEPFRWDLVSSPSQ